MKTGPDPTPRLEALPGWWRGKADTRLAFAREALDQKQDKLADLHLQKASEYEKRIVQGVVQSADIVPLRRSNEKAV
jgi:hypothetical protein